MESRNKSASIPTWFDLKKHEKGSGFPLLDWTLNLQYRRQLLGAIEFSKEIGNWNDRREEISNRSAPLFEHGFLDRGITRNIYEELIESYDREVLKPGHGLVFPLPLWRAVEIHKSIQSDTKLRNQIALVQYQEIHYNTRNESMKSKEASLDEWQSNYFYTESYDDNYDDFGSFSPHMCVDLGAPDETLLDAFKDWLKSMRKNKYFAGAELPEKVSKTLIARWMDSAILPFLDLSIYQEIENVHLPSHVIGDAIFPASADFDTTEAVRKTTRTNLNKALSQCDGIMRHAFIAEQLQHYGK